MRKVLIVTSLFSSFIASASYADDWYVGMEAGAGIFNNTKERAIPENIDILEVLPFPSNLVLESQSKTNPTGVISLILGAKLPNNFRLESSLNYTTPIELKDQMIEFVFNEKVKISSLSMMLNLYHDFKYFSDSWTPFIGVGLGYGKTAISKNIFDKKALLTGEGIVYSPSIGVNYQVNPKISLDLKYSFTILPKSKSATRALNQGPDIKFHIERSNYLHAITSGVRFSF